MNEQQVLSLLAARPDLLAALLNTTTKASGTSPQAIAPHGYNALFNVPGLSPDIVSTIVQPNGLEDYLESRGHVQMTQELNPLFGILTGQTASSGTEPTTPCDENVPIAGNLKLCMQIWPFGEMTMKSQVIRVDNAGELINRSEPLDLRLVNNPFGDTQLIPGVPNTQELFRNKLAKAVTELTLDFKRRYARLIYTGSPVNTAASTGGYLEYNGLDRIVNTGYRDAISQLACAAADSTVVNRAGAIIQNTASATMALYREYVRYIKDLANDLSITGLELAFVGRRQKFYALVDIWACAYYTYRCYNVAASNVDIGMAADSAVRLREEMLQGKYLLIDGERIPWIVDNTMEELNVGGGNFQSDTYLLPIRANGIENNQATFMQYFNYNGPYGMADLIRSIGPDNEYKVSPDGRFAIHFLSGTSFCKQVEARTRKRLIVRMPFLALKIEDERYNVYVHEREWQPGTSYFVNGGNTSYPGASYSSPI